MSSNSENSDIDPLKEEREKVQKLINDTFAEKLEENKVKLYDPIKHGEIIIINAEIVKKKKFRERIKLLYKKKSFYR